VPFGEQHFDEVAADGADSASRAGYQDWPGMCPLRCHAASLGRLSGGAMIAGDGIGACWAVNPRMTGLLTTLQPPAATYPTRPPLRFGSKTCDDQRAANHRQVTGPVA
jgi:hypothetical protein